MISTLVNKFANCKFKVNRNLKCNIIKKKKEIWNALVFKMMQEEASDFVLLICSISSDCFASLISGSNTPYSTRSFLFESNIARFPITTKEISMHNSLSLTT